MATDDLILPPQLFDVVIVRSTPTTDVQGIAGQTGVVLGVPGIDEPLGAPYAVSLHSTGEVWTVAADALERTGKHVDPLTIYPGDSIRVSAAGELLVDPPDEEPKAQRSN